MTSTVSRNDPRLMALAVAAMTHAINGRRERASKAVQAIGDEYGGDGVVQAILLWIDRLIHDSGREDEISKPVRLQFLCVETGAVDGADGVSPETAWFGQLVAARMADDEKMFAALIYSLDSDEKFGRHVRNLLSQVAQSYRLGLGKGVT